MHVIGKCTVCIVNFQQYFKTLLQMHDCDTLQILIQAHTHTHTSCHLEHLLCYTNTHAHKSTRDRAFSHVFVGVRLNIHFGRSLITVCCVFVCLFVCCLLICYVNLIGGTNCVRALLLLLLSVLWFALLIISIFGVTAKQPESF